MNFENEEARYGEATPQRAERENTADNAMVLSQEYCNRIRPEGQGRIEALLGRGVGVTMMCDRRRKDSE